MSSSQLSISALKADFSRVLQRVAQGERIAITKRGKVVTELQPPDKKTRSINEVRGLLASAKRQHKVSLDDMNIDRLERKAHTRNFRTSVDGLDFRSITAAAKFAAEKYGLTIHQARDRLRRNVPLDAPAKASRLNEGS